MKMGLQHVRVSLRGFGGESPTDKRFFTLLGSNVLHTVMLSPSKSAWQAALVNLFEVRLSDFDSHDEPREEFANKAREGFEAAAAFLATCHRNGIDQWRSLGYRSDIFIGGWLANEQFDLDIPAAFLAECGRLGLPLSICTND
jgi:hypothetical protein